jgi:hypothetical protein
LAVAIGYKAALANGAQMVFRFYGRTLESGVHTADYACSARRGKVLDAGEWRSSAARFPVNCERTFSVFWVLFLQVLAPFEKKDPSTKWTVPPWRLEGWSEQGSCGVLFSEK